MTTNNPAHSNALNFARLAGNNWRTGRDNARAMAHGFILAVSVEGFARKPLMEAMKKEMKYGRMDKADQRQVITLFSQSNKVNDAWPTLPQELRDRFITAGAKAYPYSSLASDIDKADKASEAAEAEAAFAEELAELGVTAEEYQALAEREADSKANLAAIERVLTMLASDAPRTDEESNGIARLLEALAPAPAKTGTEG